MQPPSPGTGAGVIAATLASIALGDATAQALWQAQILALAEATLQARGQVQLITYTILRNKFRKVEVRVYGVLFNPYMRKKNSLLTPT